MLLENLFRCLVEKSIGNWDFVLSIFEFSYGNNILEILKKSQFEREYDRNPKVLLI